MKLFIIATILASCFLTSQAQSITPDVNLDKFMQEFVGAWLSANLPTYLNQSLSQILGQVLGGKTTAAPNVVPIVTLPSNTNFPGLTSSTFPPLPTFAPFNPSTGLTCYVCNERNQACVAPIDPTRISTEKCSGYCVKYQNANDGNIWYRMCSTTLGISGVQQTGVWQRYGQGTIGFCNTNLCNNF